MPERLQRFRKVVDGNYRVLIGRMSSFELGGLWVAIGDSIPGFTEQAYESLIGRRHRVVPSDRAIPPAGDSILDRFPGYYLA